MFVVNSCYCIHLNIAKYVMKCTREYINVINEYKI